MGKDTKDMFHVGTVFVGNESKQKMKIVKMEERNRISNNDLYTTKIAVIENLKTKMKFCCGLDVLLNGNVTVIKC